MLLQLVSSMLVLMLRQDLHIAQPSVQGICMQRTTSANLTCMVVVMHAELLALFLRCWTFYYRRLHIQLWFH